MNTETDTPKKRLEFIFAETAKGNGQPFLDALDVDAAWTVIGSMRSVLGGTAQAPGSRGIAEARNSLNLASYLAQGIAAV